MNYTADIKEDIDELLEIACSLYKASAVFFAEYNKGKVCIKSSKMIKDTGYFDGIEILCRIELEKNKNESELKFYETQFKKLKCSYSFIKTGNEKTQHGIFILTGKKPKEINFGKAITKVLDFLKHKIEHNEISGTISFKGDIVPICAYCKSVRDNEDNWHSLEEYLINLHGVNLSHGICENCFEKHQPDLFRLMFKDNESTAAKFRTGAIKIH